MPTAWFRWLDQNPWSYWAGAVLPTIALVLVLVRTLRAEEDTVPLAARRVDWRYALLMLAFLLGWRWPPLFDAREFNPDESLLLAGAITLRHDPVFWRSVDGITSGPLNFYALMPLDLLGFSRGYLGERLSGLLLAWGAVTATYALLRSVYGTRIARVAVLPALVFFAAATDGDFVHCSSEHVSLLLAGVGAWLLWKHRPRPDDEPGSVRWPWLVGGAVVGLMPWAKLQSAPPALALAAWGAWLAFSTFPKPLRARVAQIAKLAAATAAPSLLILLGVAAAGVFQDFHRSYLLDNLVFVEHGLGYADAAAEILRMSRFTWHSRVFLAGVLLAGIAATVARRLRGRPAGPITWASLLLGLVAGWVVVAPGRGFHHYVLYTVLPLSTWAGAAYGDLAVAFARRSSRLALALAFVGVAAAPMLFVRVKKVGQPEMYGRFESAWLEPLDSVGLVLARYRREGDTLGVWGWYSRAYVQARLPQAQREAQSEHQLRDWRLRDTWFRPRYIQDLRRNRPALFVDAVGPGAFGFTERARHAHETFPELREFIARDYTLAADEGHARVYVRNDRYAEIGVVAPR